jgi:hypothetical protein
MRYKGILLLLVIGLGLNISCKKEEQEESSFVIKVYDPPLMTTEKDTGVIIDINDDKIDDLKLWCKPVSMHYNPECISVNENVKLAGIGRENLYKGDSINENLVWLNGTCCPCANQYIAIKIKDGMDNYYGWFMFEYTGVPSNIEGFSVDTIVYCKEPNKEILVGQVE